MLSDLLAKIITAEAGKLHIFFVGQAGFIFKSPRGKIIAADIYLSNCVERFEGNVGFKRLIPPILNPFECLFDVVIATHPHLDHLDLDSVPIFMSNKRTRLLASLNCKAMLEKYYLDLNRMTFVSPGDCISCSDVTMKFVPCDHGEAAPDAVGVIIKTADKNIYIAGDTCLRMDRVPLILSEGNIDVLIAPVNGAYGNMNESECAKFAAALGAKLTIPCHYGMFAAHGGDLGKFIKIMEKEYPGQKYEIMTVGEQLTL